MQTAPEGFDCDEFESSVKAICNLIAISDIHVWSRAPNEHHLTCHVAVEITEFCDCDRIVKVVEDLWHTRFNIQHSTIELVYEPGNVAPDCGTLSELSSSPRNTSENTSAS